MLADIQLNSAVRERNDRRASRSGVQRGLYCLLLAVFFFLVSSHRAISSEHIPVAAIFSETGIAASHNAPLISMTELAFESINNNGGVSGKKLELIVLDNNSTPIGSAVAAEKAVKLGVVAVIGGHWSSHSLAMAPILQEAKIPMITPASTNPEVTLTGEYIFRVCFVDSIQGRAMALFAREELKAERAALVVNIDEAYSRTLADYFEESFIAANDTIVKKIKYRRDATDFSDIIGKLKEFNPDVTYIPGYTRDSGLFIKQAVRQGLTTTFLGGDAWDEISALTGNLIDGSYQTIAWHPQVPNVKSTQLKKLYTDKHGNSLTHFSSPLAYDAVMILKEALNKCHCERGEAIKDALYGLQPFEGATGTISFNKNGDPANKAIMLVKFHEDKPVFVKTLHK